MEAVRNAALAAVIRPPSFVSRCGFTLRSVIEQAIREVKTKNKQQINRKVNICFERFIFDYLSL